MCQFLLIHASTPILKAMKIPVAKAAEDTEWDKLKNLLAWSASKVRAEAGVIHEAQNISQH